MVQKKFERKSSKVRKRSLIQATLSLIANNGIHGATVRAIAKHANVTQGLIRHYFQSKEDLISAAFRHHMNAINEEAREASQASENHSAAERLTRYVHSTLSPPAIDPESIGLWANFLNRVPYDQKMRETHRMSYFEFRDHLEVLIVDLLEEEGRTVDPKKAKQLAIACTAVVDGLWLEGGALPEAFELGEVKQIAIDSISAILGVELEKE